MSHHEKPHEPHPRVTRPPTSSTIEFMQFETLEHIAERLGWSPERLAEARAREAAARPSNLSARDRARAEAVSESLARTRRALDEAS